MDGEVYPGIIKEKAAAQSQYDTAVSQGQSAGLVKYVTVLSKAAPTPLLGLLFAWGQMKPWTQPRLSGDKCENQAWVLGGRDNVSLCVYLFIYLLCIYKITYI